MELGVNLTHAAFSPKERPAKLLQIPLGKAKLMLTVESSYAPNERGIRTVVRCILVINTRSMAAT